MFNQYKKFFNSPKEVIIKNSNHMIQLEQPDFLMNQKFLKIKVYFILLLLTISYRVTNATE